MASRRVAGPAKHLFAGFRSSQPTQHPSLTRCMATETPTPNATLSNTYINAHLDSAPTAPILEDDVSIPPPTSSTGVQHPQPMNPFITTAQCTLHAFPSMTPTTLTSYPSTHLLLPIRKDLLHRAVIYEGDMTRQGTASTKWRSEVHGSNRKVRPQKGTGSARLGDKKSPMLKGGGVAFGPKPRDFATALPRKIYDRAWRTALSYRYRKGELLLVDGEAEIHGVAAGSLSRYVLDFLQWQGMGKSGGRTLFVTSERRGRFFDALDGERMGRQARALEVDEVDVKDLLEMGRVVVEREALEQMFLEHESDLAPTQRLGAWERLMAESMGEEGVWVES